MQFSFKGRFQPIDPKVVRLKTGALHQSLRHDWTKELGSKVDRQPEGEVTRHSEGEVTRQANFFQTIQPIPHPPSVTPDVIVVQMKDKKARSQEISVNSFNEELCFSDRSGNLISRKT